MIFEVNIDQKINIVPSSTTKVVFIKSSIFIPLIWNLKRIYISGHWIQSPIILEVHIGQKVNIGRISKIVNFHPIAVKFEEEFHIWSLNWTTNYFWGHICFMDFASVVLCTTSSCLLLTKSTDFVSILMTSGPCLFVCRHDNSRTEEATNVKLHHVIQEGDG